MSESPLNGFFLPNRDELRNLANANLDLALVSKLADELTPADCSPVWLLLALRRHEKRQEWVGKVVTEQLGGDLHSIGSRGSLGHPAHPSNCGGVPDLPDWSYYFHGKGCSLENESDGSNIDVDFYDGLCSTIDPGFYERYLQRLRAPEWLEARLRFPKPMISAWEADLEPLSKAGLLDLTRHIRLTEAGRGYADDLMPIADKLIGIIKSPQDCISALCLALSFGDAKLAVEILQLKPTQDGVTSEKILKAAGQQLQTRVRSLQFRVARADVKTRGMVIQALAQMGMTHARDVIVNELRNGEFDYPAWVAMEIVKFWNETSFIHDVWHLTTHTKGENIRAQTIRVSAGEYLLRQLLSGPANLHDREKLANYLKENFASHDGHAGLLLYLLDRQAALEKLRNSLWTIRSHSASTYPPSNEDAALALAAIGSAETVKILVEALKDSSCPGSEYACAALFMTQDPTARRAAENWKIARKKKRLFWDAFKERWFGIPQPKRDIRSRIEMRVEYDIKEMRTRYRDLIQRAKAENK